jgi:hypothetical protein
MPSPFPGVDPYIEAQGLWEGFHHRLVTYSGDALNEILPPHYVADFGEHVRLVDLAVSDLKQAVPDILIARSRRRPAVSPRVRRSGGTAMLEPVKNRLPQIKVEVRDVWIEIRRLSDRTPVTMIEVLSPTNKRGEGIGEYLEKRRATTRQKIHLVEFDFLLRGERLPMENPLPPGDFYAIVSRSRKRPESDVYTWTIRDRLRPLPIPLSPPDPDVLLDLGAVFATAYERGRYAQLLDYTAPPSTLKNAADRTWAQRIAMAARR